MKINIKKQLFIVFILLALFITPIVYAASSYNFLPQAQNYINNTCGQRFASQIQIISLYCYLFYKVQEQDSILKNHGSRISNLEATVTPIPGQINSLQTRLASDEANIDSLQRIVVGLQVLLTPTTSPSQVPGEIIFAYNRPASFTTDGTTIPITPNYSWETITMHVSTTGSLYGYSLLVNLGAGDFEQVRILCPSNTCPDITIPLIQHDINGQQLYNVIYKFSTGTSSGNITAIGTLNSEPNSHTLFLGNNLTLPYTSGDLVTSGYSQIEFTVAQANPQNLKSISIQQFDGTNWNEVQHISCDGGAICPVQLESIGSTFHRIRVVVDGSGINAAVNYLIRP